MTPTLEENRKRIAYHQAGHTVAAWALGLGVKRVEIRAKDGHTDHALCVEEARATWGEIESRRRLAVIQSAGRAAEWHWNLARPFGDDGPDTINALLNIVEIWRLGGEATQSDATGEAETLVAEHSRAIEALARALLQGQGTLSGDQAIAIIECYS